MLSVDGLKVNYGKIEALKGVSLSVEPGEIVTVIGANGAGKSTVLKTLSGLILPVEGQIEYLNVRVERRSAAYRVRRGLILVPEGRSIFGRMSVYENLLIGLYARKDTSGYERDLEAVFSTFPILRQRRAMLARFLSGGEQQMLAIGRALMAEPNESVPGRAPAQIMPRWLSRCSEPRRKTMLFICGVVLILTSFVCFRPAKPSAG